MYVNKTLCSLKKQNKLFFLLYEEKHNGIVYNIQSHCGKLVFQGKHQENETRRRQEGDRVEARYHSDQGTLEVYSMSDKHRDSMGRVVMIPDFYIYFPIKILQIRITFFLKLQG